MSKKAELQQLEQDLTGLLGKKSPIRIKTPCSGKYRGYYDYGLRFGDGSNMYISLGFRNYPLKLKSKVEEYSYFRNNLPYLESKVRSVIDRDNRQAETMGLSPIEFVSLSLVTDPHDTHIFWIELVYRIKGLDIDLRYRETSLYYACLGCHTEEYFEKKINRPDDKLGSLKEADSKKFSIILLGCLR